MSKLAVVIPAYKSDFLNATLESFRQQSNKNFKIYIGNDNSPHDLESVVNLYTEDLDIVYKNFDENLGSKSLVKQWQRCIDMSNEDWIWLFSDDDIVSKTCVQSFYDAEAAHSDSSFFKFKTKMIDQFGNLIRLYFDKTNSKSHLSAEQFLTSRLRADRFRSYVVEYVFHRKLYNKLKFVDFPLAWNSDDATWFVYAKENRGITQINDYVYWRYSGLNISSNNHDKEVFVLKSNANYLFVNWLQSHKLLRTHVRAIVDFLFRQESVIDKNLSSIQQRIMQTYNGLISTADVQEGMKRFKRKNKILKLIRTVKKIWV